MIRELSDQEVKALHGELLLKRILATAEKLPPFPDVMWKVLPLIRKMAPVQEIEAVIKYDPAITAKVIALSQSVYYGRRYAVGSLQDAIVTLGGQKLVQVVLTACASNYFQGKISGYELNERELWQHSVATALLAEMMARRIKSKKVLTVYTAALLHDIGKTVLDLYAKIYLRSSLKQLRENGIKFIEAERAALGIDHQELGEIIARRWRFPPEVVTAIGQHHSPHKAANEHETAAIVYAANEMVIAMEADETGDATFNAEEDSVFKDLGVTNEIVEELQVKLKEALEGITQFLQPG